MTAKLEEYRPPFAKHVRGVHSPRVRGRETGGIEPFAWSATCEYSGCGENIQGVCDSGRVREKIGKWAILHLHRDVLAPPR